MAVITVQWWRRLVNAYEVKTGMVCLQCNNCVIHTWALQRRASHIGALYKSSFLYLYLLLCVCVCVCVCVIPEIRMNYASVWLCPAVKIRKPASQ